MHKSLVALVGAAGIGFAALAAPPRQTPVVLVAPSAPEYLAA